jgi:adenine-specific DNA-methyltransferase
MTEQVDEEGNLLTSNPETSGRYHSAWLSMMYPRLFLARQLLREDGAIFVSIDDNELQNLRLCMNEVFGEENFIATVIWQKVYAPKNTAKHFSVDHDYIVVYARNAQEWRPELLPRSEEAKARYSNPDDDPRGPWKASDLTARNYYSKGQYEATGPGGKTFRPTVGNYWRVSEDKFHDLDEDNRIWWGPDGSSMPALKRFLSEVKEGVVPQTLWSYEEVGHTQEAKKELISRVDFQETENVLNSVKPPRLLRRILQVATEPDGDDIAFDFFAGSAPLAQAVMEQNREDGGHRRFVCVQFPEPLPRPEEKLTTIADLGKARVRSLIEEFHSGESDLDFEAQDEEREDLGFRVYKLGESHYRNWSGVEDKEAEELTEEMELFTDPLLPGWEPEEVIWEVAIKEGYSLTSTIEELERTADNTVYRVCDDDRNQSFLICLDEELDGDIGADLGLGEEDVFVCRDIALTDEQAANLALQCRLKTI